MTNLKIRKVLKEVDVISYVRDSWNILKENGYEAENVLNCSLGVNPYGSSPMAIEAVKKIDWDMLSEYPHPNYKDLRESISRYWDDISGFKESEIFLGTGSIGILDTLTKLLIEKGSKILGYSPQFNEFENLSKIIGSEYVYMKLDEDESFKFSTEKFIKLIDDSYDVIYIDNPNNPTGQVIKLDDIEKIIKEAERYNIPVIVDEAYGEFMDKSNSAIGLADNYSNVIIVRSFSKGYGLANIRLGYIIINKSLKKYYKMINIPPFVFADMFADIVTETLEDKEFLKASKKKIKENKAKFIKFASKDYIVSATHLEVPIITVGTKKEVDFYSELLKVGILPTAGADFRNLNERFVRLRIPRDVNKLIKRFENLQI